MYLQALAAIALSLSLLMAGAWMVQRRTGNSGWVDTIWTFSIGLVGAACALWLLTGSPPNARQWLVAALVAVWSLRLGLHIVVRTSGSTDDPRYAAFAREWGDDSLFDHLVGSREQPGRYFEAHPLGGLEVDYQFKLGRQLYRQIGRLLALEDTTGIYCRLSKQFGDIDAAGHQAAVSKVPFADTCSAAR